jgi:heme exporter protein C
MFWKPASEAMLQQFGERVISSIITSKANSVLAALKRLWHKLGSPRWFFALTSFWVSLFGWAALLFLLVGAVWGLAFAPADYQQGNSFRIMYVHVPAAMLAQSLYIGMGVAGFIGLVWRMKLTDVFIAASLPLGMVVTALALFSG